MEGNSRKGEELDLDALMPWLAKHVPSIEGTPAITQFSGGASNWTYRLHFNQQDLILRRAPLGAKASGAHDMAREFHLQSAIKPHFDYVPGMVALCEDEAVLGSMFYVMKPIEGIIPRKNFSKGYQPEEQVAATLCTNFWDKMVELHHIDYEKEGLTSLGKGDGYVERQIVGWNKRYANAKTWNVLSGKKVMKWLEQNIPKEERLCIVHNDFRLDNVVLNPDNLADIVGVLDWELAAIGDPLMDLGNSLAYWVEEKDDFFIKSLRRQPSNVAGMMTRKQVIDYYQQQSGMEIGDFRFYRVYGLFRLAGIVQQIYYRYSKGLTTNKAFKNFWMISNYIILTCQNVINQK